MSGQNRGTQRRSIAEQWPLAHSPVEGSGPFQRKGESSLRKNKQLFILVNMNGKALK